MYNEIEHTVTTDENGVTEITVFLDSQQVIILDDAYGHWRITEHTTLGGGIEKAHLIHECNVRAFSALNLLRQEYIERNRKTGEYGSYYYYYYINAKQHNSQPDRKYDLVLFTKHIKQELKTK